MANAILLNQSTELTKENILDQLDVEDIVTNISKNNNSTTNGNPHLELTVSALKKDGSTTTLANIDLTDNIKNFLTNYITYDDDDTTYEAGT